MRLKGKVVLITGGTSGMGAATAKLFSEEGALVVVTGSSQKSVDAAQKEMSGIKAIHSDAGDTEAIEKLVREIKAEYGRVDVLFVNAGIARISPISAATEQHFNEIFRVNVRGPYMLLHHALSIMPDGSSIILTSSTGANQGIPGLSAYSASKAALQSLGKTLAVELASRKIRVNTITPGAINTPIGGKMQLTQEQMAGIAKIKEKIPLGRSGNPEEIAAAALYFASDDSRFTTGASLIVDGGLTLA